MLVLLLAMVEAYEVLCYVKNCGCKKLKSSNILGEMFQIFVCLFTYLVILDGNFNVIIFFWTSE